MHAITAGNLRNAHGGESMAHMRYKVWGDVAQREGFQNVARLFRAISSAETIHATNHFLELKSEAGDSLCASMAVFGLGSTSQNLQGGINGETYEITEMYPTYLETAKFQGEKGRSRVSIMPFRLRKRMLPYFRKLRQPLTPVSKMLISARLEYAISAVGPTREIYLKNVRFVVLPEISSRLLPESCPTQSQPACFGKLSLCWTESFRITLP